MVAKSARATAGNINTAMIIAAALIEGSSLGDPEARRALWDGGWDAVVASDDPFIKLALAIEGCVGVQGHLGEGLDHVELLDQLRHRQMLEAGLIGQGLQRVGAG